MPLELWQRASNYMGEDLSDYYVILGQHRDSEYVSQSNFRVALKRLGGENEPYVIVAHFSNWLVGWSENILVRKDASKEILDEAERIVNELDEYSILDENDYDEIKRPAEERMFNEIKQDVENARENGETVCKYWNDLPVDATDEDIWDIVYESVV